MPRCVDAPRAGVKGCGIEWTGTAIAHCVARCAHSAHEDGRCHETFSSNSAADLHWVGQGGVKGRKVGREVHTPPEIVDGLELVQRAGGGKVWTPVRPPASQEMADANG